MFFLYLFLRFLVWPQTYSLPPSVLAFIQMTLSVLLTDGAELVQEAPAPLGGFARVYMLRLFSCQDPGARWRPGHSGQFRSLVLS